MAGLERKRTSSPARPSRPTPGPRHFDPPGHRRGSRPRPGRGGSGFSAARPSPPPEARSPPRLRAGPRPWSSSPERSPPSPPTWRRLGSARRWPQKPRPWDSASSVPRDHRPAQRIGGRRRLQRGAREKLPRRSGGLAGIARRPGRLPTMGRQPAGAARTTRHAGGLSRG
jgi:hypothetical protein